MTKRQDTTMNTHLTPHAGRNQRRAGGRRSDAGAVLGFVLIFFMFVGVTVVATLTFASTLMRNRPPVNERNARVEAVRSGMRMAIQFQRDHGVGECFQESQSFTFNAGTPEEATASVTCSIGPVEELSNNYFREGGDAYALVTTIRDGSLPPVSGSSNLASQPLKVIEGNVFIGGGDVNIAPVPPRATGVDVLVGNQTGGIASEILGTRLTGPRYANGVATVTCDDPLVDLYLPSSGTVNGVNHSNTKQCTDLEWTDRVGTRVAPATTWSYPTLPGLPANNRPVFNPRQFPIGSTACQVIFPGRYDMPINLNSGGEYYLPSGLYYFTKPVTISNGSTVVAGQGRKGGCEVDSTVLLDPRTIDLEATSITGRGATFLLDKDATVNIGDGQLFMNRRISTPSTRGSEGVSIRSVQTSTINTASLYVPEDQVVTGLDSNGDRILEPASSYTIDGGSLQYSGLTAPGVNVPLVTADFRGHSGAAFVVDGNIFVPQGKFVVHADHPNYELSLDGGVVATRAQLDIQAMPADPNDWYLGVDASPLLRRVELVATATVNGKTARSVASFQVNSVGSYAINSWIVDPDHTTVATTVPSGTTTTTTVPSGTTTTTTVPSGTTTTTTVPSGPTTTTTVPATTACTDPTKWAVSYWDNTTLTGPPAAEVCEAAVSHDWVAGGPAGTDFDLFSGRWTKTVNFPAGNYAFTIGADDGVRMRIDGTTVYSRWVNKSFSTESVVVPLTSGNHVIEVDYYEWGGNAQLAMDWSTVPVCAADQPQWYGRYYNGTSLSNFRFDRYDDSPNFDWGNGHPSQGSLDVGGNNTFSASWTRTQNFPGAGTYRFTVGSDDGTRLYVNGNRVINNWNNQSYNQSVRSVDVDIQDPCQVQLELRYYENTGEARVSYDVVKIS